MENQTTGESPSRSASCSASCSASLAQCSFCGHDIPIKKQRVFQKTAKHVFKKTGKMPTGPYCNVGCRSAYFSEIAAEEFRQIHSQNALAQASADTIPTTKEKN